MKYFGNIVIQEKSSEDFRAFAHVTDSENNDWELRGYGSTPGKAADDAYARFMLDESEWDNFGYTIVGE